MYTFIYFKLNLKKIYTNYPILPLIYTLLSAKQLPITHVSHNPIRLSAFNFQRFQYNFVGNRPMSCEARREDVAYLLFDCPTYAVPRHADTDSVITPNCT